MSPIEFQQRVLAWFERNGRKDLPWQQTITPYRIWVSETMLQQTQVTTVIPYFLAFVEQFPTVEKLAATPIDDVLKYWAGLGYYARARNLHKSAQLIIKQGYFPNTLKELTALPGIGRSTAGAILSIAFKQSAPILDGNVKRVLTRFYTITGWPGLSSVNKQLWSLSESLTPLSRVDEYTQAIMDLGATLCTRSKPNCKECPINTHCLAWLNNTQLAYPTPKPKKTLPIKSVIFLLLTDHQQRIWLEKRPTQGIWGGLWSLLEFASMEQARHWCLNQKFNIINDYPLPTQRHTFSHYHLDYTPIVIQIENPINFVMEDRLGLWYNAGWFEFRQLSELGLPAPIKTLLQSFNNEEHDDKTSALRKIG